MNKIIFSCLLTFTTIHIYSQPYLNVYAGANYSMLTSHNNDGYPNKILNYISFSAGTSLTIPIYKKFELLTELDYSMYSSAIRSEFYFYQSNKTSHLEIYNYDLILGYLSFSLLPQISIGKNRIFFFNIGPYISILINSSMKGYSTFGYNNYSGGTEDWNWLSGSASQFFNRLDFGVTSNIGFNIRIFKNLFLVPNLKYKYGLSDIGDGYFKKYNIQMFNRDISFTLGIKFRLGKTKNEANAPATATTPTAMLQAKTSPLLRLQTDH